MQEHPAEIQSEQESKEENTPTETAAEALPEQDGAQQEIQKLKDALLRQHAENDNLRKRHEREIQQAHKFGVERMVKDLIPVLDSLTLGIEAAQKNQENQGLSEFVQGSEMTLKLLLDILQRHGIEEINPLGEKLNPELHQALSMVPSPDAEANSIIHVAQKGYLLHGRVIRAAQVVVAAKA